MNSEALKRQFRANYGIDFPAPTDSFNDFLGMSKSGELCQRLGNVHLVNFESPAEPKWIGKLIPFMWQPHPKFNDFYCFDTENGKDGNRRISVFSIHTTVHGWSDFEGFLQWVRLQSHNLSAGG